MQIPRRLLTLVLVTVDLLLPFASAAPIDASLVKRGAGCSKCGGGGSRPSSPVRQQHSSPATKASSSARGASSSAPKASNSPRTSAPAAHASPSRWSSSTGSSHGSSHSSLSSKSSKSDFSPKSSPERGPTKTFMWRPPPPAKTQTHTAKLADGGKYQYQTSTYQKVHLKKTQQEAKSVRTPGHGSRPGGKTGPAAADKGKAPAQHSGIKINEGKGRGKAPAQASTSTDKGKGKAVGRPSSGSSSDSD